jgi:ribosomal protein S18 acetylase RimI-like enzyme
MAEPIQSVTLRAAAPADQDFLRDVFASTRSEELVALGWNPTQSQNFIDLQFGAQQRTYQECYPAAENSIILLDERPIGRMIVDRSEDEITLVDIALLPAHRNAGIGTHLLNALQHEAARVGKAVRLNVFITNPAARLYERLGFSSVSDDAMYREMIWLPTSP